MGKDSQEEAQRRTQLWRWTTKRHLCQGMSGCRGQSAAGQVVDLGFSTQWGWAWTAAGPPSLDPGSHPAPSLVNLSLCFPIFALGNPPHWPPDSKTERHLSLTCLHAVASFSLLLRVVPIIASANDLTPFLFPCPAHPWRTSLEFHITFPTTLFWFTIFSFCYMRVCQSSLGQIAFSNNGYNNISHSMCLSSIDTDNPSGEAGSRSPLLEIWKDFWLMRIEGRWHKKQWAIIDRKKKKTGWKRQHSFYLVSWNFYPWAVSWSDSRLPCCREAQCQWVNITRWFQMSLHIFLPEVLDIIEQNKHVPCVPFQNF